MLFCLEIFICYKESYIATLVMSKSNVIILIENWNVFIKEELLGIFG